MITINIFFLVIKINIIYSSNYNKYSLFWYFSKNFNILVITINICNDNSGTWRLGCTPPQGFCQGGGKLFQAAREARFFLPPSVWGQSYNREGQTFVTFIHHDLVICVVLAFHFFDNSESQLTYRN